MNKWKLDLIREYRWWYKNRKYFIKVQVVVYDIFSNFYLPSIYLLSKIDIKKNVKIVIFPPQIKTKLSTLTYSYSVQVVNSFFGQCSG